MPADHEPEKRALTLRIGCLRRFARPRRGPEKQPPVDLEITNLKMTFPATEPPVAEQSNTPTLPARRPSLLTRLIPAWPDPEYRRWLTTHVLLPLLLGLAFIALIFIIGR